MNHDLRALAAASQRIASNALALRGQRLFSCGALPDEPWHARARVAGFGEMLAALAVAPSLLAAEDLPARWRIALRLLGFPILDELASTALAHGVSVLGLSPQLWTIEVERQDRFYIARATCAQRRAA